MPWRPSVLFVNLLGVGSMLLAATAIASAAYLHQRRVTLAWWGEVDCGVRPLTAAESADANFRVVAWEGAALGASLSKETAILFHDDGATRTGNGVVLLKVVVPLWLPVALSVPGQVAWLVHLRRGRTRVERRAAGLCETCGYDLRGLTSGRCPECGTPA